MVLRPHLDDEEVEPIRALCLQNLRSLEDDPGTKVIYELRRRHFPDPWGRPSPGTTEGVSAPDRPRPPRVPPGDLPAQRGDPGRGRRDRLAEPARHRRPALRRLEAEARAQRCANGPAGPPRDHILRETQQIQIALAYPGGNGRPAPTIIVPAPPPRSWAAIPRPGSSPRSARNAGFATRSTPATRASATAAAMLCYAGTSTDRAQQTLDVILAEIERLGRDGVEPEELETMRAGLKSSLIMAQESSMSRSGCPGVRLVLPGPGPPARRDLRRSSMR